MGEEEEEAAAVVAEDALHRAPWAWEEEGDASRHRVVVVVVVVEAEEEVLEEDVARRGEHRSDGVPLPDVALSEDDLRHADEARPGGELWVIFVCVFVFA